MSILLSPTVNKIGGISNFYIGHASLNVFFFTEGRAPICVYAPRPGDPNHIVSVCLQFYRYSCVAEFTYFDVENDY